MAPKFKAQLRIPTPEMYSYIEITVEDTAENILSLHNQFLRLVKPQEGIDEKNFRVFLENQALGKPNDINTYLAMSPKQQEIVQTNKRLFKRIKAHEEEDEVENDFIPSDGPKDQAERG